MRVPDDRPLRGLQSPERVVDQHRSAEHRLWVVDVPQFLRTWNMFSSLQKKEGLRKEGESG